MLPRGHKTAFSAFEALESRQLLAAVAWDGGGNGVDWADPLNWSNNALPTAADDVLIDAPSVTVRHQAGVSSVRSLDVRSPFLLAGGTLAPATASSFAADLTLAAGTLAGVGDITLRGTTAWTGGTMEGTGKTIVAPTGTLTANAGVLNLWRSLDNGGTFNWQPGRLDMIEAILTNLPGGVFFANGTGQVQGLSGVTRIINQGVFTRGGGGTTTFQPGVGFNNAGTLNTIDGSLRAFGGGVSTGAFNLNAPMELAGTTVFFATSSVDGPGGVTFAGGSATVNGTFSPSQISFATGTTTTFNGAVSTDVDFAVGSGANVELNNALTPVFEVVVNGGVLSVNSPQSWPRLTVNSGELTGSGQITVTNQHTWNGGLQSGFGRTIVAEGATLTIGASVTLDRSLENAGTANWNSGTINLQTAILTNLATGVWNCLTTSQITDGTGASQVVNLGLWTSPGANVTMGGSVALSNTGRIEWSGGAFSIGGPIAQLSGGTLSGGTWSVRGAGNIQFPSNVSTNQAVLEFRNSGSFSNLGLALNEGEIRFLESRGWAQSVAVNAGVILLEGSTGQFTTISNSGLIRLTQSAQVTLSPNGPHSGDFEVQSGQLRFSGDHVFESTSAISGAGSLAFTNFGADPILAAITVTGEVRAESSSVTFGTPLNVGSLYIASRAVFLEPVTVQSFQPASNANLTFNAATNLLSSGFWSSVTLDGPGAVRVGGSGGMSNGFLLGSGDLEVAPGATIDMSNTQVSRRVVNHGTVTVSGSFFVLNDATLRNESDGRVNVNAPISRQGQSAVFENYGVVGGGNFTTHSGVVFNHYGSLASGMGSLNINGGGEATGSFVTASGSNFNGGYTFLPGSTIRTASFGNGEYLLQGTIADSSSLSAGGATLTFAVDATVTTLNMSSSTLNGPGTLRVRSDLSTASTAIGGSGDLILLPGSNSNIQTGTTLLRDVINLGNLGWFGNSTVGGITITNPTGSTMNFSVPATLALSGTTPAMLDSNGLIRFTGGSNSEFNFGSSMRILSLGSLEVESARMRTSLPGVFGGTILLTNGQFYGDVVQELLPDLATTMGGFGSLIRFAMGQSVPGTLALGGGTLQHEGAITITGALTGTGAIVTSNPSGVLTIAPGASFSSTSASIFGSIDNAGSLSGAFSFSRPSPATQGVTLLNRTGATLTVQGTWSSGDTSVLLQNLGTVSGSATMAIARIRNETGGIWNAGVQANQNTEWVNEVGATMTLTNAGNSNSNAPLVNRGTLTVSGTSNLRINNLGTLTVAGGTLNTGSGLGLEQRATATFAAGSTVNGPATFFAGSTTSMLGTANLSSTIESGAVVNLSGTHSDSGNFIVNGTLNWTGGTITGTPRMQISSNGVLSISSVATKNLQRSIENYGTITVAGGSVSLSGAIITNYGTMTVAGGVTLSRTAGAVAVQNLGSFNKSADAAAATFGPAFAFNNLGAVQVAGGSLALNGGGIHDGQFSVAEGASVVFASNHSLGTESAFSGNGTLSITGGTTEFFGDVTLARLLLNGGNVRGDGDITLAAGLTFTSGTLAGTGNLTLQSGSTSTIAGAGRSINRTTVNAGVLTLSTNTLTVNGTYTQLATGELASVLATRGNPGTNGALVVNGAATIDGALSVDRASVNPIAGDSFVFLSATTLNGAFATLPVSAGAGRVWQPTPAGGNFAMTVLPAFSWTGRSDGRSWSVAGNWAAGLIPVATSDATIPAGGTEPIWVDTGSWSVRSLISGRSVRVDGGTLTLAGAATSTVTGSLDIVAGGVVVTSGHTLNITGTASSAANLDLAGRINAAAASFTAASTLTTRLDAQAGGRLVVAGAASLDGVLVNTFVDGFNPATPILSTWDSTVLQAGSIAGSFGAVTIPTVPVGGMIFRSDATTLKLLFNIYDFDGNGGVDADDVTAFFTAWDAGNTFADINGDGGVDADDLIVFFAGWDAGGR
jgi:hypothetical protein